jgi:hypothetical protein
MELPEIPQVRDGKASSITFLKPVGQILDHPFPVFGTLLTLLDFLHDFPADQPVSHNCIAIDRPHNIAACLFQDSHNSVKEAAFFPTQFMVVCFHPWLSCPLSF